MSWLSKAVRRNKKFIRKAVTKAASVATGGLSDKAIQLGRAIGQNVSSRKIAEKVARIPKPQYDMLSAKSRVSSVPQPKAVAMPGGAPLRKPAKRRKAAAPKAPKKKAAPRTKAKRTAPKGGLDLKALSVKWKAAGKPGKWIDWVKANK